MADAEEGTNVWIWTHPQFKDWEGADFGILWIEGKPGSGKSVLAKSLQKRLSPSLPKRSTDLTVNSNPQLNSTLFVRSKIPSVRLVADWFYSTRLGNSGMSHTSLLRSVLYQLLDQNGSLFQFIAPYYRASLSRSSPAETDLEFSNWCNSPEFGATEASKILEEISASGTTIVCIIDAMDEAKAVTVPHDHKRTKTILAMLCDLISNVKGSRIKFIVLSRPDPLIELDFSRVQRKLPNAFRVLLEKENKADIELLINKGLGTLRNAIHAYDSGGESLHLDLRKQLPKSRKNKGLRTMQTSLSKLETAALENIRSYLRENANGVILWVTLILGDLEENAAYGMSSFAELEVRLKSLPLELDRLYARILHSLQERLGQEELAKARQTLILVCGAAALGRPLTIREIWEALAVPSDIDAALQSLTDPITNNRAIISSWTNFRRQLRRKCGPLIEVIRSGDAADSRDDTDIGPDDIVQFIHRTVKDFLQAHDGAGPLHFSESNAAFQVKELAKTYAKIAFPPEHTPYLPVLQGHKGCDWRANIRGLVDYFEQKILFPFICSVLSGDAMSIRDTLGISASTFDNIIYPSPPHWSETGIGKELGEEARFYPWSAGQFHSPTTIRAVLLGYTFYYSCRRGHVVATRNLLIFFLSLHARYTRGNAYTIANGALRTAIEMALLVEVQQLTSGDRHQGDFVVPKPRKLDLDIDSELCDPFLALAVETGSTPIIDYLFESTKKFCDRQAVIYEMAVTTDEIGYDEDIPTRNTLWSRSDDTPKSKCHNRAKRKGTKQESEDATDIEDVQEAIRAVMDLCVRFFCHLSS